MSSSKTSCWVYSFGGSKTDGDASMRDLLGGKGANLAEMARLGLPVPPGFTITTQACNAHYDHHRTLPPGLKEQVRTALSNLQTTTGRTLGDHQKPLLVSVRSGARVSMPGMMDTVLNLGLTEASAAGLAQLTGDARFAADTHRRFIQMYADVVLGAGHEQFEDILEDYKEHHGLDSDTAMSADNWNDIVALYMNTGVEIPDDPEEQLWGAIAAVFDSWMSARAMTWRELHDIPAQWGTAVTVQSMVFGNMGDGSATGVCFTRDPSGGENSFYGEYLINAQGEDVVAGIRTPAPISVEHGSRIGSTDPSLEETLPEVYADLRSLAGRLETHYRDMQDIEFTVENGVLFLLQTRSGKRTARAALKIAADMNREGIISSEEAVLRVDPASLDQLMHPALDSGARRDVFVSGLQASPGAATGQVAFVADEAVEMAAQGLDVVLMRTETSPEDIHGMHAAGAIVTARGGMTSHAAVVARGMGRPCVCGAGQLRIDVAAGEAMASGRTVRRGDVVTVDGSSGQVLMGAAKMVEPDMGGDFSTILGFADGIRRLQVRANAETPEDVERAKNFGAEGIGLCRTEHMFFAPERILQVRAMILASDDARRSQAIAALLPMQRADFHRIFSIMGSRPCTMRLLDPPLHEFVPRSSAEIAQIASALAVSAQDIVARIAQMHETNPMLGHRGCRLGISFPEIYAMQTTAILEAALEVAGQGLEPAVEIMVPLVGSQREMEMLASQIDHTAQEVFDRHGRSVSWQAGAMIELPRAALRAADIAPHAAFFSFGTNDLTQMTYGLSRDDAGNFLKVYADTGVFLSDPFATLDTIGVGELVRLAAERGRAARPDIKLGVCGEHGGDPDSIAFFDSVGLDYVSCSPYRVPVARLAAAHAVLQSGA